MAKYLEPHFGRQGFGGSTQSSVIRTVGTDLRRRTILEQIDQSPLEDAMGRLDRCFRGISLRTYLAMGFRRVEKWFRC
jgi:hypothetical protein